MTQLNVAGITIDYQPGQTYFGPAEDVPNPEKEKSRADTRADAINKFKAAAQRSTLGPIEQTVQQLFGLLIQFRALGGTMAGSEIPNQLREAADFMEDL